MANSQLRDHAGAPVPLALLVVPLFVALATVVPLWYLLVRALAAEPAALWALVWRPRTLQLLGNTAALTGGVLVLTTVIALPLGWLTARTELRAHRWITLLSVLPLAIPGYVMAHALLGLGGATGMAATIGWHIARPTGWFGATLALSLYAYPYLFLNVRAAFMAVDPGIEESARSLGYTPRAVFARVVLPMVVPGLLSGWLIVALYTVGDFGAVALMRYEVFSYAIYTQYAGAFDRVYAAALALILVLLAALLLAAESRLLRREPLARTGQGAARRHALHPLGRWRPAAYAFVGLVFAVSIGLPLLSLVYWMGVAPPWTQLGRVWRAFGASVAAAAPAALLAVLLALPIAYLRVRYPQRPARLAERTAYIGYAIPPLALALAFVFFALRAVPLLYQRLPLLVVAYALNFLALAMGPLRNALLLAPRRLEEAARSLGRRPLVAFLTAVVPVLRRGILAAFTLVFVMAMKELPIAFILAPTGFSTLSMAVFARTSEGLFAEAAPFATAIVIFSSMFVSLMLRYEGRH